MTCCINYSYFLANSQSDVQFLFNSTNMLPQCTSLAVEDDDVVEPCKFLANVTIASSSERSVIDPSSSSAVISVYDDEGKHNE